MPTNSDPKNRVNRRLYMYRYGTDEFAVAKFLQQSKTELTKAGAKGAGSVPQAFTHRAAFISTLPSKCDEIIAKWFNKNPIEGEICDLNEAISALSSAPDGFDHSQDSSKKLWRTIFINFINKENTGVVRNFLRGESKVKVVESKPIKSEKKPMKAVEKKEVIPDSIDSQVKNSALSIRSASSNYGFRYIEPAKLDLEIKEKARGAPVLGRVENILSNGQFYIDIKGILINEQLVVLNESQAVLLFPERGNAVCFPDRLVHFSPTENLLAVWQVHDQENNKSARYMVDSCVNIVFDVFDIPHSSLEPDLVREWLKTSYTAIQGIRPVFQLSDGVIIKTQALIGDFRTYDFALPFFGYYSHEAINWNGRRIVVRPFSAPSFKYECLSTETAVKRLFEYRAEITDLPLLTNKQIKELAYLASKESVDGYYSQPYQSIASRVSSLFEIKENIDLLLDQLMELPELKDRVAVEIADLKKEAAERLADENHQIERLRNEKKFLESEVKKSSNMVSKEIKKAFEGAVKDGMKTLSDVALLRPFLTGVPSSIDFPDSPSIASEIIIERKNENTNYSRLSKSTDLVALRYGLKQNLLSAFVAAGLYKGVVGVYGINNQKLIEAVANILSNGCYASISISVDTFSFNDLLNLPVQLNGIDAPPLLFGSLLDAWSEIDIPLIIELGGFNRIPPESILSDLLSNGNFFQRQRRYVWKSHAHEVKSLNLIAPVIFVLNFAYGKSTFTIPRPYWDEIPLISNDLFDIDPDDENYDIPLISSYIGQHFTDECLRTLNPKSGFVELLKMLGFLDSEAICYSKLIFSIGRVDGEELKGIFVNNPELLDFLNLNSPPSEISDFLFDRR